MHYHIFEQVGRVLGQRAVEADVAGAVIATPPARFHLLHKNLVDLHAHACAPAGHQRRQCRLHLLMVPTLQHGGLLGGRAGRRRSHHQVRECEFNLCPRPVRDVNGVLHAPDPGVGGIGRGDWGGVDDGRAFLLDPVKLGLNKLGNRADTQLARRRDTDAPVWRVHAQVEAFDGLIVDLDAQVVDGDDGGVGHGYDYNIRVFHDDVRYGEICAIEGYTRCSMTRCTMTLSSA